MCVVGIKLYFRVKRSSWTPCEASVCVSSSWCVPGMATSEDVLFLAYTHKRSALRWHSCTLASSSCWDASLCASLSDRPEDLPCASVWKTNLQIEPGFLKQALQIKSINLHSLFYNVSQSLFNQLSYDQILHPLTFQEHYPACKWSLWLYHVQVCILYESDVLNYLFSIISVDVVL